MNLKSRPWIIVGVVALVCVVAQIIVLATPLPYGMTQTTNAKLQSFRRISHSEWEQLLPNTEFYLQEYEFHADDPSIQIRYVLVVEQGWWRYYPRTYDQLLMVNHIELTKENRELIAKAWALMTIGDLLGEDVDFTSWEQNTEPRYASLEVYDLKGWSRLGGAELTWTFAFNNPEYKLVMLGPSVLQWGIGDYIEQEPWESISLDSNAFYFFPVQ